MKHGERIGLTHEAGVEVEEKIEAPVGFGLVNFCGHEEVCGVMISFGLDKAAIKGSEFGLGCLEVGGKELEFLTAPAFNKAATEQMVYDLQPAAVADGPHQALNPRAGTWLAKGDAAPLEEVEHELEVLEF